MRFKSQIRKMSLKQLNELKNRIWYDLQYNIPDKLDHRYKLIYLINERMAKLQLQQVNTIIKKVKEKNNE